MVAVAGEHKTLAACLVVAACRMEAAVGADGQHVWQTVDLHSVGRDLGLPLYLQVER